MHVPTEIPNIEDIPPEKNQEQWYVPEEEDTDESCERSIIRINTCPFGGGLCKPHNFKNACVWSLNETNGNIQVLKYLVQHATHSAHHEFDDDKAYNAVCTLWGSLDWNVHKEPFSERAEYRKGVKKQKAAQEREKKKEKDAKWEREKKKEKQDRDRDRDRAVRTVPSRTLQKEREDAKRKWRTSDGERDDRHSHAKAEQRDDHHERHAKTEQLTPDDSASGVGSRASGSGDQHVQTPMVSHLQKSIQDNVAVQVCGMVNELLQERFPHGTEIPSAGSSGGFAAISGVAPTRAPTMQIGNGGGTHPLAVAQDHIAVPMAKLIIIQDNLQRAEHSMASGLTTLVEAARKLETERRIVQNTIRIVSETTGVQPSSSLG